MSPPLKAPFHSKYTIIHRSVSNGQTQMLQERTDDKIWKSKRANVPDWPSCSMTTGHDSLAAHLHSIGLYVDLNVASECRTSAKSAGALITTIQRKIPPKIPRPLLSYFSIIYVYVSLVISEWWDILH